MRLFALIGGLLVLLLAAALVVPPLVDWTSYRADFERAASLLLGQPVKVRGAASARLLPLPRIVFEDVTIGEAADGAPLMAADRFTLDMELAPLLSGEVRIVSVDLARPRGRIRVREDGSFDWLERRAGLEPLTGRMARRMRVVPGDVSIEAVRVFDGELTLLDERRGATLTLTDLDAELSARSLAGPWRGAGTLTHGGERYHVSGSTGSLRRDGETLRVTTRVNVKPASRPYDVSLAGPLTVSPAGVALDGTFRIDPASPASLEATPDFLRSRLDEALPVSVEGRVALSPQRLTVPQMVLRVGGGDDPYRLTGTAEAFLEGEGRGGRRYQVSLEGAQVDIDRLAAAEDRAETADAVSIEARLLALRDVLDRIPRPDLPGEVRLNLPALVAGDTVVREVALVARPLERGEGWRIDRLVANLPGRTLVEVSGRLGIPVPPGGEDAPPSAALADVTFEGDVLLASRQPSGFARWLTRDVDDAIRALPRAGFQAKVAIGPDRTRFDDLELQLGSDRLTGKLARIGGSETGRPRLLANLRGERIDVDTASALFGLFAGASGPSLVAHDLDLRLSAGEAVLDGVEARGVEVALLYDDGDLTIDRLSVEAVAGGAIEARGKVVSLYERPRGSLDGRVEVRRGAPFTAFVGDRFGLPPVFAHVLRDPTLIDGTDLAFAFEASSAGLSSRLQLTLDGSLGGTRLVAVTRYEGELAELAKGELDLAIDATHGEPGRLFDQLGLVSPAPSVAGPGALTVKVRGRPDDALALDATLATATAVFGTEGRLRYEEGVGDAYAGTFSLSGDNVDPLLLATGIAFPGTGLGADLGPGFGTKADLKGNVSADATRLAVTARGEAAGTRLDADLTLDLEAQPRPQMKGSLLLDRLALQSLAAYVWGPTVDAGALTGAAEPIAFGAPTFGGVDGTVRLKARQADLDLGLLGADPAREFAATLLLTDGDIRLTGIRADWLDGRLSGALGMSKVGGEGAISANLKLDGADIAATGLAATEEPLLTGRFGLDLAVEAQGSDLGVLLDRLTGGGVLRIDGRLARFDPQALAAIVAAADATPDERLEDAAPTLVREALLRGTTPVAASVPLAIAAGTVRISGVALDWPGLDAVLDLRADLTDATLDGTLRATFEAAGDGQTDRTNRTDRADDGAGAAAAVGAVASGVSPDLRLEIGGTFAAPTARLDATALTTFLTTRLRERREREFEAQRAAVLERQRLAREMRLMRAEERAHRARRAAEGAVRRERDGKPEDARLPGLPGSPG